MYVFEMREQLQNEPRCMYAFNRCKMDFNFMYLIAAPTLNEPVNDLLLTIDSLTSLSAMDAFAVEAHSAS